MYFFHKYVGYKIRSTRPVVLQKFFLKIFSELAGKELYARVSFIIKVHAECIMPNVYVRIISGTGIFH